MSEQVVIHSDGGADPNPGIGGWAALLRFGNHERVLTGSAQRTTNNRMELSAAIGALQALNRPVDIVFHTDSEYLRRGITQGVAKWAEAGWKTKNGRAVSNADLWQQLQELVNRHRIEWRWVRGHSGDPDNERVDMLARQARLAITPRIILDSDAPRLYLRAMVHGNPGPGAWGAALEKGGTWVAESGVEEATTNNRMELLAAIEGLAMLDAGSRVQVFTTSDYLFQGMTQWVRGWQSHDWQKKDGRPVANADLWRALVELTKRYQVHWVNAKGQALTGLAHAAKAANEAMRERA